MLSIGRLGGSGGAPRSASYYTSSVAKGREDYYTGHGEAPGHWTGAGSQDLDLAGEVDGADLAALMNGLDPGSGAELRAMHGDRPVTGFDLTFSSPKSVSLLYALGDRRISAAAAQAHDEAVAAGLRYMEAHACRARRGRGGRTAVVGEGFVAAAFRHRTNRAGDPHLHTHVVVGNLTRGPDGRHTALDGREIYRHAKVGGTIYQAELRARLTDYLGVDWRDVRNGLAEIRGVPSGVLDHFSQRRAEIKDELATRASSSARSAQAAALKTRRPKDRQVDGHRLAEDWRARAQEHGFTDRDLERIVGRIDRRPETTADQLRELARDLAGADGLTAQQSTFDRRAVVTAFAAGHSHGETLEQIEYLADRFLDSQHVVPLGDEHPVSSTGVRRDDTTGEVVVGNLPSYTTPDLLAAEAALIESAMRRKGEGAGLADPERIDECLTFGEIHIAGEQEQIVVDLATSGDGVQLVCAPAGTGKTTTLAAVAEAWRQSGKRVVVATLAARVASEIHAETGIDTLTIRQLVTDLDRGWSSSPDTVVVIEEAGMVGTRDIAKIERDTAANGAKLVLIGDPYQLPSIDAGGTFAALVDRLGASELKRNRRQHEVADQAALLDLRQGDVRKWVDHTEARDGLIVTRNPIELYERIVSDWWHGSQDLPSDKRALMLAATREATAELNIRARSYMRLAGRLTSNDLEIAGTPFAVGDRVLTHEQNKTFGLLNGWCGTVTAIEPDSLSLRVDIDGHGERVVPASFVDAGNLGHAYALTVHKSQGITAERVYCLGSLDYYRELAYTANSRFRDVSPFYVCVGEDTGNQLQFELVGHEREQALEKIAAALGRSRAQELALDVHERDTDVRRRTDDELADDAGRLADLLESFPAAARAAERDAADLARRERQIRDDEKRLAASRAERAAAHRRDRDELDSRIQRQEAALERARADYGQTVDRVDAGRADGDAWLDAHGVELAEATAIELELAERRQRAYVDALVRAAHVRTDEIAEALGPRPRSLIDRERWDRDAFTLASYRLRYGELPAEAPPLAPEQRQAWDNARAVLHDPALGLDEIAQLGLDLE